MKEIRILWENIFKHGKKSIYRRILRTALFGSLVTFLAVCFILFFGIIISNRVTEKQNVILSENVKKYLEDTWKEDVRAYLGEMTTLRANLVRNNLENCSVTTKFLADKMTNILKDNDKYIPSNLPVANYVDIAERIPYLYFNPNLLDSGINEDIEREISFACAIVDDMKTINRNYFGVMIAASKKGYMICLDMSSDYDEDSNLNYEQIRKSYDFLNSDWFKITERENKLIVSNPYMTPYGKMRVSVSAPYYDDTGFAGVMMLDVNFAYIEDLLKASQTDNSKFSFVMGKNGEILASPYQEGIFSPNMNEDLRKSSDTSLAEAAKHMTAGEQGFTTVKANGEYYYLAYVPIANTEWSLGTIVDITQVAAVTNDIEKYVFNVNDIINDTTDYLNYFFLVITLLSVLLFIAVLYWIIKANVKMSESVAEPIKLLTEGVQEIAKGNLEKKLCIKTGDEIETLADSFNHMTNQLKIYIENLTQTTIQKERIEAELSVAASIQAGMLPDMTAHLSENKAFNLSALMYPAKEVGGDFYDFYLLDKNHLVVTVADVSDKGIPAALFMALSKTLLKEEILFAGEEVNLGKVFEKVNNALTSSNKENMFVTVFVGILNLDNGEFIYANAGHNPPVLRKNKEWSYIPKAINPIIGMIENLTFKSEKIKLNPGDAIFLYTDGVTEARNSQKIFFGERRLLEVVKQSSNDAANDINNVFAAVKNFVGSAVQSDDITMLELIYSDSTNGGMHEQHE